MTNMLEQGLEPIVKKVINEKISLNDISCIVKKESEKLLNQESNIVVLKKSDGKIKKMLTHKQFNDLLEVVAIPGLNVLLTGGPGLSKSTAVIQAADALGLEFTSISFSNHTTKTDLLGFIDAHGIYRESSFIDAFRNGKVFLADELDACASNILVLLNSAISNGIITTPDNETIKMHDNFRFVATANTNLKGSDGSFTARNRLDAATIDRFVVINWELDEKLEEKIANHKPWVNIVRRLRDFAKSNFDDIIITPRSSYIGAKLLRAGLPVDKVIHMTITRGMPMDQKRMLCDKVTDRMIEEVRNHG